MEKFVSYNKMSKKAQKEYNSVKRNDWGMVNPSAQIHKSKNPKFFYKSDRNKDKSKISHMNY